MWDDKLEGKEVFVADYIEILIKAVNTQDSRKTQIQKTCENYYKGKYPFCNIRNENFKFAYYDPNYELKIAHHNGDAIEFYDEESKEWLEEKEPKWWDNVKYRVKQNDVKQNDKICTNSQLAKWLAQGNGECKVATLVSTYHFYEEKNADNELEYFLVRRWDDEDWHKPTLDYMGIK